MNLLVLGINHKTAALEVRERVAFAPEQMEDALCGLREESGASDAAILSTCNRTELYVCGAASVESVLAWLAGYHHLTTEQLGPCYYSYEDDVAVRHMMQVASGLDSMVLGEPQILGQIKSSYAVAQVASALGEPLHAVFQQVFSTAKRVRTETAIGENPVSVAYAAVSLAQQIFSDLSQNTALLIGAGETIELVARHLKDNGVQQLIVANRTLSRAKDVAEEFGAEPILLADLHDQLPRADIVIASTASQLPILGKGAVESALKARKHNPMFMVDIAVPRDIEPEVAELEDVYLYTVDDLKDVIEEGVKSRESAAQEAVEIIEEDLQQFVRARKARSASETIRAFRSVAETVRDEELEKALLQLRKGEDPEKVLAAMARTLTNKLLHTPTSRLSQASADGRSEVLTLMHELYDLDISRIQSDS
ncbi:MAG: glutamyl-tRNA reductase [Cellvibrionaceae bacterium]